MKRLIVFLWIAVAIVLGAQNTPVGARSTDNFTISNYDVEMWLDKDSENRSTLKTTETITAEFPQSNQNHGLEKVFVRDYNGHSTDLQLQSVTDETGRDQPYHWSGDALRIGDKNTYVHGQKTYKITYTQRDVTRYYQDTNKDEFYWDVIGVEWRVPITTATVTVHLSDAIKKSLQTQPICYQGAQGSRETCTVRVSGDGQVIAMATNLGSSKGMTVALGFTPGTFAAYKEPAYLKFVWLLVGLVVFLQIVGFIAAIAGGIYLGRKRKQLSQTPEIAVVQNRATIPEYLPPKEYSVLDSSVVQEDAVGGKAVAAQLIDWAVRHYIEIRLTKEKSIWRSAEYTFEVKKSFENLSQHEKQLAATLFNGEPQLGVTLTTKELAKRSQKITSSLSKLTDSIKKATDLYAENTTVREYQKKVGKQSLIGFGALIFNVPLLILGTIAYSLSAIFKTEKGEELKKYLDGLKMYIEVAEEERLKMLQSPEGAEKVGDVSSDKGARIKLYEKVLPYAILFGQEKQWATELGKLYEETGTSPEWNPGTTAFNAAMFSSMMGDVTSGVTSASSYSSSSGGSGGGGSSGGGGGGGGGGGW